MIPSMDHQAPVRDRLHGSWQSGEASDVGGSDPLTLNADLCDIIADLKFASHSD